MCDKAAFGFINVLKMLDQLQFFTWITCSRSSQDIKNALLHTSDFLFIFENKRCHKVEASFYYVVRHGLYLEKYLFFGGVPLERHA